MRENIYRIINVYGKKEFCRRVRICLQNQYDKYNLEKGLLYIDEISENDVRIGDSEIFPFSHFEAEDLNEEREIMFFVAEKNSSKKLEYFLKKPLDIFFYTDILSNRQALTEVVREYPFLLFTLVKEKYRQYISCVGIASLLIGNRIYPIRNICIKVIEEVFKNREYKLEYIYHFIVCSSLSIYIEYRDDENIIDKSEKTFIKLMIPYLSDSFEDTSFLKDIINKATNQGDLQSIESVVLLFSDSEEVEEYINVQKEMMMSTEKQKKSNILGLKNIKNVGIEECRQYLDSLDKYIMTNTFNKKINEHYVLEFIPQELFEKKDFLLMAARKSFGLSKYSRHFNDDKEIILEEIRHDCLPIYTLDDKFLRDSNFVLELRTVYNRVLFYISEELLNDYGFMLNYIMRYPIDKYFVLGRELSMNKNFLFAAIKYDVYILSYCLYELREDALFMQKAININYHCIHFVGEKLKNNKAFILAVSSTKNIW